MYLSQMSWPQCGKIDWTHVLAILPLGSTEQHGRHLPCNTDTLLVTRIAEALEARRSQHVLLLPTMWLGHSPHHLSFGATLSAGHNAYADMLVQIAGSLQEMGCGNLLLLNGHGGNRTPATAALQEMKDRWPKLRAMLTDYWAPAAMDIQKIAEGGVTGMGHAGELETSLYMYLCPELVNQSEILDAGQGNCPAGDAYQGYMLRGSPLAWVDNFSEITETGAFGKPTLASAQKGEHFFYCIVEAAQRLIDAVLKRMEGDTHEPASGVIG